MMMRSIADIRSQRLRCSHWRMGVLLASLVTTVCIEGDLVQAAPPDAQNGQITGKLCYPSEWIPAMTVYAQNLTTGQTIRTMRPADSTDYVFSVPPGRYLVYSWSDPESSGADAFGQGYADSSACDALTPAAAATCHSNAKLAVVDVAPGARISSIDLCDYPKAIPQP